MEAIVITGSFFLLIYGLVKLGKESKDRKMMIQAGFDPTQQPVSSEQNTTLWLLKWGIVFVGIGLGLFLAEILEQYYKMGQDTAYVAMVLIFGGVSFIVSHVIVSNQMKKKSGKGE